ncbi:MAG: segregation and condensation protein A [Phycisphaerae bacterium]
MNEYRVSLDVYNGPLDLLLFLIRRDEIDIHNIPIAEITEQYVRYVEILQQMDPESAGAFLVLAASLMEIKSRLMLPKPPPEEQEDDLGDPRMELVRQLLEYKKYKDSAHELAERAQRQALQHPRRPAVAARDAEEIELDHLEIWDLVDAFSRLLEQTGRKSTIHRIEVDDTPIALHAEDIVDALEHNDRSMPFADVFSGRGRSEMIGLFLALLELVRQRRVRAVQDGPGRPIYLFLVVENPAGAEDKPQFDGLVREDATGSARDSAKESAEPSPIQPKPAGAEHDTGAGVASDASPTGKLSEDLVESETAHEAE